MNSTTQDHGSVNASSHPSESKRDDERPKRPLSAYNLFFHMERHRLVNGINAPYTRQEIFDMSMHPAPEYKKKRCHRNIHGKIGFIDLAKTIAVRWKSMDQTQRELFEERAAQGKAIYANQVYDWLMKQTPTPAIKKRLAALKRGSLGQYLPKKDLKKKSNVGIMPKPTIHSSTSTEAIMNEKMPSLFNNFMAHSPCTTLASATFQALSHSPPCVNAPHPHDEHNRCDHHHAYPHVSLTHEHQHVQSEKKLLRAMHLSHLYRLQMQLYQEQIRLQMEIEDQAKGSAASTAPCNNQIHQGCPPNSSEGQPSDASAFMVFQNEGKQSHQLSDDLLCFPTILEEEDDILEQPVLMQVLPADYDLLLSPEETLQNHQRNDTSLKTIHYFSD